LSVHMRLLLDQNLSFKLLTNLEKFYAGSAHVRILGLDRAKDLEIWEFARKRGFTLVTRDSDFYEYSTLLGFPPKVIWIRSGNTSTLYTRDLLLSSRKVIDRFLRDKKLGCLELF